MDNQKVGIIGLWHLGCVLCAAWSKLGLKVVGFDYDTKIIRDLQNWTFPVFEPFLLDVLVEAEDKGNLMFTNDIDNLQACSFVFLSYDTPVLSNDESDISPLQRAIDDLSIVLSDDTVVIVSSQTPIGTCNKFRKNLQMKNPSIELVYSPENLRLGDALQCYLNPGRIIIGSDSEEGFFKTIPLFEKIRAEIIKMSIASAEMMKHALNSYLASSIVFANHLSDLCEVTGANIFDVVKGMRTDPRIGEKAYLNPGIGFSGGTLGRDLQILSKTNETHGQCAFLFKSLFMFNSYRKNIIIDKINTIIRGKLTEKIISILGLTYKPGTSTLRRSLPLEIVKILAQNGTRVKVYDPKANYKELDEELSFEICGSIDEAISNSHLVVLLTEWPEFKEYNWKKGLNLMKDPIVFDTKNFLYDLRLSDLGYSYFGIGFRN